jgi:23S rRNA pseudouridine1911/1915/1917 synthase
MAHIGHPIIGDELYGGDTSDISRQALHCLKMCFDGKNTFYAPLSDDISLLIRSYFGNEEFIPKNQ